MLIRHIYWLLEHKWLLNESNGFPIARRRTCQNLCLVPHVRVYVRKGYCAIAVLVLHESEAPLADNGQSGASCSRGKAKEKVVLLIVIVSQKRGHDSVDLSIHWLIQR